MAIVTITEAELDALKDTIIGLQRQARDPLLPFAQRMALFGLAQALREQQVELEAARFEESDTAYKTARAELDKGMKDLKATIAKIDKAIENLEKATKLVGILDKILTAAADFVF